jgi:hypothetical protein
VNHHIGGGFRHVGLQVVIFREHPMIDPALVVFTAATKAVLPQLAARLHPDSEVPIPT